MNAMSIDLEDWFCANNLQIKTKDWDSYDFRAVGSTHKILNILEKRKTKATFFALGWVVERASDLIRDIERAGHEIATHGYSHRLLTEMSPEEFEADITKALEITKACTSAPILGFRAPSFTITKKTLWAIDILVKHGIRYDSSIFPVGFHPDYGIADAPLSIHPFGGLTEVPLSVAEIMGKRIPCSGGGYFRLFPYSITKYLIKKCNEQGRPVIFYLHPWELDPEQPRRNLSVSKKFRHYNNLEKTAKRLDILCNEFEFVPIKHLLDI